MFCVECGKEDKLYESLCSECYLSKNAFVTIPKQIDVEVCVHCGARKRGKSWILGGGEDFIEDIVRENMDLHKDVKDFDVHLTSQFEEKNLVNVSVISHANVLGLKAEEKHKTKVRMKKTVCTECSKKHGGYWEAKVQLRGSKRGLNHEDLERALELVGFWAGEREGKDKGSYLTKIEKMHNGLDFYLGSKNLGKVISKKLANQFGGNVKESFQLMGRKDGKDVYRATYAVRSSDFRVGDFISQGENVFKVLSLSTNKVLLRTLDSWKNVSLGFNDLEGAKLLGGKEIVKEMVLVSASEDEIQVLDPDTLKTVDVVLPQGFVVGGESVMVVKCEAGYFLVGED